MVNTLRSVIDAARIDAFLTEDRAVERNRSRHFLTISIDPSPALFLKQRFKDFPSPRANIEPKGREREKKKEKLQNYSRRQTIETQSSILEINNGSKRSIFFYRTTFIEHV